MREYLKGNNGVEVLYLTTAMSKLSAVESVWKDAKYWLATSKYYETPDLTHVVS